MSSTPLFLDRDLHFDGEDKYAGMMTRLSDNTDLWPQEIIQEAFKQLPYLSDFEPTVVLDKVEEERGYAFGSIEVRPKTAMTMEEQEVSPLKKVHIPLVVREQQLCPLDIFMIGRKYHHLTEGRLRSALFRADTFDAARIRPYDPSLANELFPPIRGGYGGFGGGGAKLASLLPLLPQLHGKVHPDHVERMKKEAASPAVVGLLKKANKGVRAAFQSAVGLEVSDPMKTAEVLEDFIRPTVVQFRKQPDGQVMIKWANADMYTPQQEVVPQDVAQDMAGEADLSPYMESDGTVTMSPDATVKETLDTDDIRVADQFGLWQVQDLQGNALIGWVFPQVMTLSLQPMPLALFTNGSNFALQETIAGKLAGKSTDIPKGVPAGYGTLYYIDHGTARAFIPMTITASTRGPDGGVRHLGVNDMGEQVVFSFGDGLKVPVRVSPEEFIVPASFNWLPLKGKTELVTEPVMFSKTSMDLKTIIEIVGDKESIFSFRGAPLAKVAASDCKFINRPDAEFLAVALGLTPEFAKTALNRAAKGELVEVRGVRVLGDPREKLAQARERVKTALANSGVEIRNYCLVKEAALLDDALSADKVLSLGFINAENIADFVTMLPALEDTSSRIAGLLLAVRIGLRDIPEVAVERMLFSMEDVIRGLKTLQQKEVGFEN